MYGLYRDSRRNSRVESSASTHATGDSSETVADARKLDMSDKSNSIDDKSLQLDCDNAKNDIGKPAAAEVEATSQDVAHIVDNCWMQIEEQRQCELEKRKMTATVDGGSKSKGWKTIRVFVSSTFTDMHSEREILIKQVTSMSRFECVIASI